MFKKNKIQLLLLYALLFLGLSCTNNDEGNYNYNQINEINVSGIEKNYTVYNGDHLTITPNLNATLDDGTDPDRYTYEWVAINPLKNGNEQQNVIATTKNLDLDLKLAPAEYKLYFFVKDKVTGVKWQKEPIVLSVISSIYEGWLVIGDDAQGKARLDMVALLPNIAEPRITTDVLEKAGSALKLSGKAVNVSCFKNPLSGSQITGIYVTASESGTSRIDEDSFSWVPSQNIAYEILDNSFSSNFGVDFMISILSGENFLYSKGNIYYFYRTQQIRYSLPQNKVDTETKPFYASPFIAINSGFLGSPVFYDRDGKRFLRYNCISSICSKIPSPTGAGVVLDWNNTNSDLVYMVSTSYNGGENFAVLKNNSTGKFNLLRFNGTFNQVYYKEIMNAPDFEKASKFAVSPDSGYLFYKVGGKLYEYDFVTQSAKLMLDKGTDEITYIGFHPNAKTFANKLVVGSYGASGKLEIYQVPPINGDLILNKSYSGLCKIVDVAYRPR